MELSQCVTRALGDAHIVVQSTRVGAFNGSLTLSHSIRGSKTFKQKEMRSCLQKAVRRQSYPKAKLAVVHYVILNSQSKGGMTWLFNRLCLIAKEDCATVLSCFYHACELRKRYNTSGMLAASDRTAGVTLDDILAVVHFLCTHGTSRLPSWMRAKYGTTQCATPVKNIVAGLTAALVC